MSTINKVTDRLDTDGTISYDAMPWHVLGPLICVQALQMFQSRCSVIGDGREDKFGFNVVTWKVDKSEPGYNESNLPGYNKNQWYLDPKEAKKLARNVIENPNAWVVPIWSIYRESDLEAPELALFNSSNSIYKYIVQ